MKPSEALNEIKKELTTVFGEGLSARILFTARDKSNAPIVGLNAEKYLALVDALCSDERIKDMWGDFAVKGKRSRWVTLV